MCSLLYHFSNIVFMTTEGAAFLLILIGYMNSKICCYSLPLGGCIQLMEMETLGYIQTSGTFDYFHKFYYIPFFLQNSFMKKVTFHIPLLSSAKYSQQSAWVLSQRTYIASSFLVSDSPSKRCLDSHLCLEKSISAAKAFSTGFLIDCPEPLLLNADSW